MKITGKTFDRLRDELGIAVAWQFETVTDWRQAWQAFHRARAYWIYDDRSILDSHIQTAMQRLFPNVGKRH